jgi:hypothetical protein
MSRQIQLSPTMIFMEGRREMQAPRRLDIDGLVRSGMRATHSLAVFVDGDRQQHVLSYDVDAGEVVRLMTDKHGNFLVADGEMLTVRLRGRVAVQLRELEHG